MSESCLHNPSSRLLLMEQQVDQTCDRFERAWKSAATAIERPRIEDYLGPLTEPEGPLLLSELVRLDVYYRRLHGEGPQPGDYDRRFSGLGPDWLAEALASRAPVRPDRASASTPVPSLADAPTIPGYEIQGLLGRGGMGVIYQAWQVGLKRRVALKMIRDQGGATAQELARFATEAAAVARVQHPNIVQIYEIGKHAGRPFFSLELLAGGNLEQKLAGAPLPAASAARLVETLAGAVHYAHQHGILHRDLKPANVLLTAEGQPKIADFGLAKLFGEPGESTPGFQTQSGTTLGTPSYMAPEQARGHCKDLGPAVDLYALGAILYEVLTGRPPFRGETPLETLRQVQAEEPVSVVRLQPKVPRDLNTICLKCLQKEPHNRYASAEALADDLRRFLAGKPIQARPIRTGERVVKWMKRRPALAALLGVSGLASLALVGVGIALWYNGQLTTAIDEANKQRAAAVMLHAAAEELRAEAVDFQLRVRYARDMNLALQAFEGEHDGYVVELLNGMRPQPGQEDLRGFGWFHLWRRLHRERFSWRDPMGFAWSGFAPDGKTLATVNADGTLRLWDVATGKQRAALSRVPTNCFPFLAFGPDGSTMAAGNAEGIVRLWDVATGVERASLTGHTGAVGPVAYSPDGKLLATGGGDGTAKLWDPASRKERATLAGHKGAIRSIAYSPDGKLLATGGEDGTAKLWDLATGQERVTLAGEYHRIGAVFFSPDNKVLATIGERTSPSWGVGHLWDVATGQKRANLSGRPGYAIGVPAFAPDGKTVVTTEGHPFLPTAPGYVKLRDVATGEERATWTVPMQAWGAAFAPDGRTLAVGNGSGVVRLLDLTTKEVRATFRGHIGRVNFVAFSPDGTMLLATSAPWNQTVKFWDVTADPEPGIVRLEGLFQYGPGAQLAPGGKTVAAIHGQTVTLWDLGTGQAQASFQGHSDNVSSVAFSSDGKTLATASKDKTVRLWDMATGKQLAVLPGHTEGVIGAAFTPDGKILASHSWDKTVRLWDVAKRQERTLLKGHTSHVWSMVFAPDGQSLATAAEDKTIKLWDVATGLLRFTLAGHTGGCMHAAFAPDGKTLASAGWDGTVRLWDPTTGKERATLKGHMASVTVVAFAPDGKTLASGGYDFTVKLWDVVTGLERFTLKGHTGQITQLMFAPDGKLLVTASLDKAVRLWHAADDTEPEQPRLTEAPSSQHHFTWHLREAEDCLKSGNPAAARWHLRWIETAPANEVLAAHRAKICAELAKGDKTGP
ncbi:MAG TPA: protein kinase [Gemmataceae bacterium]|nr:protein kinase [Gemmataceae bacterium]